MGNLHVNGKLTEKRARLIRGFILPYTIKLKHFSFLDIFIGALGFVIGIFLGYVVTGIKIYPWIIVMMFLLSSFRPWEREAGRPARYNLGEGLSLFDIP